MALEYSEVMAAGAMFFTKSELDQASETNKSLGDWILNAKKKVEDNVEFGSSRNEFISFMEPTPAALKEAAVGISAAKAIKEWLKYQPETSFHTDDLDNFLNEEWLANNSNGLLA